MTAKISVPEAVRLLGCSRTSLYLRIEEGKVQAEKVGRFWQVNKESLEHYQYHDGTRRTSAEPEKGLLTALQLSKKLGCSVHTIYRWIWDKKIWATKIHNEWIVKYNESA